VQVYIRGERLGRTGLTPPNRCCMACIMYADDLMLLSASVSGLQQLLDVCAHNAKDFCLQFNDKKSHCIVVGPKHKCKLPTLSLSGKPLQWFESVKYLGITFLSSKVFSVDLNQLRHKFFGCTNSILVHSSGVSELMKLHLMRVTVTQFCHMHLNVLT